MFLSRDRGSDSGIRILRACGDVSTFTCTITDIIKVFSAHAEMFPKAIYHLTEKDRILRACGDVSFPTLGSLHISWYSPRMRRCFPTKILKSEKGKVFSAHAEMFLIRKLIKRNSRSILRACGDVSQARQMAQLGIKYSPRMRRCF